MRVGIYVRMSRDKFGAGLGIERQAADCRELADRLAWAVAEVYEDNDISAYSGKPRPGYQAMLDDIRGRRIDAVIAWHTDRLHRSPTELEEYITACDLGGIPTHTVRAGPLDLTTPSGRLVARQLGAVARYEVEHMIERQKRAKLQAASAGEWLGGWRRFGYSADGMTVIPSEAAEVLQATKDALAGVPLRRIAADLNDRGVMSVTGAPWRQEMVRRLVSRAHNAGLVEMNGEILGPGQWPAIVPESLWRGAVALVMDPSRLTHTSSARRWLGGGRFLCFCGSKVRATRNNYGLNRSPYLVYICDSGVKHLTKTAHPVDALVVNAIVRRLSRKDARALLAKPDVDVSALRSEAVSLNAQLDEMAAMYARRILTASQLQTGTGELRRQLADVEQRIGAAARESAVAHLVGVPDVRVAWDALDLDRQRAVITELLTVTLLKSPKGRPPGWKPGESYLHPGSVQITWRDI